MDHVGGLGGVDQHSAIRAHPHALGLDADRDLREHLGVVDVDDGHQVIVFVGDVERIAGGMEDKQLRIGSRRQGSDDPLTLQIDHLNRVVVAGADQKRTSILGERNASSAAGQP